MDSSKNSFIEPFASTATGIEHWKGILDLIKHLTTLSSAISIVCIAMYEKINISEEYKFFLIASIGLFICTSASATIAHIVYVGSFRRGLYNIKERNTLGWAITLTGVSLFFAFCSLLTYVCLAFPKI